MGVSRLPGQSRTRDDVLEGPIAAVAVERIGEQPGHEQVGMPVVIVIAHGHALAVTLCPGDRCDPGCPRHVLERAVATIAKEAVARVRRGRPRATIPRMQVPALDAVDVEPAVPIEVEQPHAS